MTQSENERELTLVDRISFDNDEDSIEFEPARLNLESRVAEL